MMAIRLIDLREKVQNNFKNLIQNSDDNMLITLESLALGVQVIPTLFLENNSDNDIIGKI